MLLLGFSKYVEAEDADILCLNETKCDVLRLASIDDRYPVSPLCTLTVPVSMN